MCPPRWPPLDALMTPFARVRTFLEILMRDLGFHLPGRLDVNPGRYKPAPGRPLRLLILSYWQLFAERVCGFRVREDSDSTRGRPG